MNEPLFEVKDIPGKGRGLIARVDIPQGTRILCEKPLFLIYARDQSHAAVEQDIVSKLRSLPKESQGQFLSLHNISPGKYPFTGIFKTNALPCGPDSDFGAVYPTVSLINHSCEPNSHSSWDSDAKHETVHAFRSISSWEEITVSYDPPHLTTPVRQAFLKERFDLYCKCCACTRSSLEMLISDRRRERIQALDRATIEPERLKTKPKEALKYYYALHQLLKEEYGGCLGAINSSVYYDAFQVCIAHGDQARASVFAEK